MDPSNTDKIKLLKEQLEQQNQQEIIRNLEFQLKRGKEQQVIKQLEEESELFKLHQTIDRLVKENSQLNPRFLPQMLTPREQHSPTLTAPRELLLQQGPQELFYETSTPQTLYSGTIRDTFPYKCDRCDRTTKSTRRGPGKQTYCAACGMEYDKVRKGDIPEEKFIKKIRRDEKGRKIAEDSNYT